MMGSAAAVSAAVGLGLLGGDAEGDAGAVTGAGRDVELSTEGLGAVLHMVEAAQFVWVEGDGIEADAVVVDLEEEVIGLIEEVDVDTRSLGVLDDVPEGLFGDEVDAVALLRGEGGFGAGEEEDGEGVLVAEGIAVLSEGVEEVAFGDDGRAEGVEAGLQLGEGGVGEVLDVLDRVGDIAVDADLLEANEGGFGGEGDGIEGLEEGGVEVVGEAAAFLLDGDLLDRGVEASVVDGDGGGGGEGFDEFKVGRVEAMGAGVDDFEDAEGVMME
jgi:hypothetical protein